jgi:ESS family glutamate:Na+ symporter
MAEGFAGGHGTAGIIGNYYKDLGLPYWETAQGLTAASATVGLIAGMLIGIATLNYAARRGKAAFLTKPGLLPRGLKRGFVQKDEEARVFGRETTYNSSITPLSFHTALILGGCGLAYMVMNVVKSHHVPIIYQLPIWVYGLIIMFGINALIQKTGLKRLVDAGVKGKITGFLTDYAIVAAIASLPVQGLIHYIVPFAVLMVLGLMGTYSAVFFISWSVFKGKNDYALERGLAVWGTMTGVFFTGLMLLRLADSDYKSPVLNDYSVSFSLTTLSGYILMPLTVTFLVNQGFWANILLQGGVTALAVLVLVLSTVRKKAQ